LPSRYEKMILIKNFAQQDPSREELELVYRIVSIILDNRKLKNQTKYLEESITRALM
jgi:hypothetical protein